MYVFLGGPWTPVLEVNSLGQLLACLLAHHVLGVPIRPVGVRRTDPLLVLAVGGRRTSERAARSLADTKLVVVGSIRPGSRVVTSWNSQALPSGSLIVANEP